ncbi:DUF2306 domain-containing protein [Hymenobacter crusticola]|uniref:DUF2306 domain-containing protein n=1 Tax=Hymenobacter crusticola TaxID=1770526 RepID=A0A243W8Q9_9BACT|nr:hypothetical protein [Hymenobacter crusticola]OUJ71750.1 hypothetical protein BXP70_20540 [Hymenobacter crusticola]
MAADDETYRMPKLVYSHWGLLHLIAATASLLLGTIVLALSKGGKRHKRLGYSYVGSMAVMLATSFTIYRQFHGFGIFHVAALLSSVTLSAGMVPMLRKKPVHSWRQWHYSFMYLSVLELYVALVAEVLVRRPGMSFWEVASLSSTTVMLPGALLFTRFRKRWQAPSPRARLATKSAINAAA